MQARSVPIDIAELLRPFGNGRAGVDVHVDGDAAPTYWQLRTARAEARAAERWAAADGSLDTMTAVDDWRRVKRLAVICLSRQTKDFQIAAWLTEALVRLDGLIGLAAGADLMSGLLAQYWDDGFPREDDGAPDGQGLSRRAAPFEVMVGARYFYGGDGTILQPLWLLPLFRLGEGRWMSLDDWRAVAKWQGLSDTEVARQRPVRGVSDFASLRRAAIADVDARQATEERVEIALRAWDMLTSAVSDRFGWEAPDLRPVWLMLTGIRDIAQGRAPSRVPD